jgi:hypothetical protein
MKKRFDRQKRLETETQIVLTDKQVKRLKTKLTDRQTKRNIKKAF